MKPPSNVILIGMPGSGKSTIGVLLAKRTGMAFVDTDLLIQTATGRTLQDIVDRDGYLDLRRTEERILLGLSVQGHVIATGGSAVYSRTAMEHLRALGTIVFLKVDPATLRLRVRDYATRGLARRPDQTLEDLFEERSALYAEHAGVTIECADLGHEEVCDAVVAALGRNSGTP